MKLKLILFTISAMLLGGLFICFTINDPSHLSFAHAANEEKSKNLINFEWIEKGYAGQLGDIELKLRTSREDLLQQRGIPIETGYYEGGEYYQYEDVTFFVNPETNLVVAIAMNIADQQLMIKDIKRALGTPDVSEENKMEDLWMLEYRLGKNILMFEAEDSEPTTIVEFVWLREVLE